MLLDSSQIAALDAISAASLRQSAKDGASLELSFVGFLPHWAVYMQEITITHHGATLFHGKITSANQSNRGGSISSSVTANDMFWLLDHTTDSEQVAQVRGSVSSAPASGSKLTLSRSGGGRSYKKLASGCQVSATGWVRPSASSPASGSVRLKISGSVAKRRCLSATRRNSGAQTMLRAVKSAIKYNPDMTLRPDYDTGEILLSTAQEAPVLTLDTAVVSLLSADNLEPQYDKGVSGVALVLTDSNGGVARSYVYPEGLDTGSSGVKVIRVSAAHGNAGGTETARQYHAAANTLMWRGSVQLLAAELHASPISCRLNLTGEGCAPQWASMNALVHDVEWDFLAGTVTLTLDQDDAEFADSADAEDESWNDDGGSGDDGPGGDDPGDDPGDEDTPRSDSPTDPPSDFPGIPTGWPTFIPTDLPTGAPSDIPDFPTDLPTAQPTSKPNPPTSTPPTGTPPTSKPPTSTPPDPWTPTHIPEDPSATPSGCHCAPLWEALETWKQSIENRLKQLEDNSPTGGDGCHHSFDEDWFEVDATGLVTLKTTPLRTIANAAADAMTLDLHVQGLAEITEIRGELHADTTLTTGMDNPGVATLISYADNGNIA